MWPQENYFSWLWFFGEGNSNPLQYSCLENSVDGGTWWFTVHRAGKESDTTERLHFTSCSFWYNGHKDADEITFMKQWGNIWPVPGTQNVLLFHIPFLFLFPSALSFPSSSILSLHRGSCMNIQLLSFASLLGSKFTDPSHSQDSCIALLGCTSSTDQPSNTQS